MSEFVWREGTTLHLPLKARVAVKKGNMIVHDDDGYARAAADSGDGAHRVVGVATHDASGGASNGATYVDVRRGLAVAREQSATPGEVVRVEELGKDVFAEGPQKLNRSNNSGAYAIAGRLADFVDDQPWVLIS